jgi:hypothetical protein
MLANIYNLTLAKMKAFGEKFPDVHVSTVDSCTKAILFLSPYNFQANFFSSFSHRGNIPCEAGK